MNIIIQNNGEFYIQETAAKQEASESLETLRQIEQVVREQLVYSAETHPDRFSNVSTESLYEQLRQKAWELQSEAPSAKLAVEMGDICTRIETLVSNKLNLNADTMQLVLSHLPVDELKNVKRASRQLRNEVGKIEISLAKKFGFEGESSRKAVKYLKNLVGILVESMGVPPHSDPVVTMANIDSLSPDVFRIHGSKGLLLFSDSPKMLRYLLSKGVDPKVAEAGGIYPLLSAVREHNVESVRLLIEHGANVHTTLRGYSIYFNLFYSPSSVEQEKIKEIASLLIQAGANLNVEVLDRNLRKETPLSYCVRVFDDVNFVKFMLSKGAQVNFGGDSCSPLVPLYHTHNVEMAKCLLEAGANPNVRTTLRYENGTPLLHFLLDQPQIVELFLKFGADVNVQDDCSNSPLILAASQNLLNTVKVLLTHGARTDLKNRDQQTALDVTTSPEIKRLLS